MSNYPPARSSFLSILPTEFEADDIKVSEHGGFTVVEIRAAGLNLFLTAEAAAVLAAKLSEAVSR